MKTLQLHRKRRFFGSVKDRRKTLPMVWLFMAAGYLIGCMIGACVAIRADTSWMTNLFAEPVDKTAPDLFSAFCGYCTYGFVMLMLATSYLGFMFIPGVLAIKGFLAGCLFTAGMRAVSSGGLYMAAVELMIPGVFLVPSLLILGRLCMNWSVRLFRCRSGEALPPGPNCAGALGLVLILILMASAAKTYAVPFILDLI